VEVGPLRLFFGLPLPAEVQERLGCWQREQEGSARWSRPEGLHLTLAFLGARPAEALRELGELAWDVAGRHGIFELQTADLVGFPRARAARVIGQGLEPSPALEALAADLRGLLEASGQAFDAKPLRPHLTLARFQPPRPVMAFASPPRTTFRVDQLVLFESQPGGRYVPLRGCPLRRV